MNAVKEMKDSPSIPESSGPSVTKGVKFAVSLLILIINYSTFSTVHEYELKNMVSPYFFNGCKLNQRLHNGKTVWE